jgi:hypothetical protein
MKRRFKRWLDSIASGALMSLAAISGSHELQAGPIDPALIVRTPVTRRHACAKDHSVPYKRGVAILSPIESPDRCPAYVGGKTVYTAYYPDYLPHRKRGDRIVIPGNGNGYLWWGEAAGVPGSTEPVEGVSRDYGYYSGARQDEANLLRLGGDGNMSEVAGEPAAAQADLIDELEWNGHGCSDQD